MKKQLSEKIIACDPRFENIHKLAEGWDNSSNDPVHSPNHYTQGKIECIDFIYDKNLNFSLGSAIKYIVRAGHKFSEGMSITDKAIQDLEKAKQYLDFEIEHLRGEK